MLIVSRKSFASTALLAAITALASIPAEAATPPTVVAHQTTSTTREETVDQRIATLHSELKITQAEEPAWQAVAQTMHDNAANMEKLAADKASNQKQGMTAVEDLQTYAEFAKAHYDGLTKLITNFQTLYDQMPDPQKKVADQVFANSRRQEASAAR